MDSANHESLNGISGMSGKCERMKYGRGQGSSLTWKEWKKIKQKLHKKVEWML